MAHAYNTLAADGDRLSGTMAADAGGPVGIIEVYDGGDDAAASATEGDPVPDETGASGENKTDREAGDRSRGVADDGQVDPARTVVTVGHRAAARRPATPTVGQDRDHRRQRRRLVLRRDAEDHRLRLGRASPTR